LTLGAIAATAPAAVPPGDASSSIRNDWVDRFVGSDPGLNRFRDALQSVLTVGLALLAEWLFVRFTHALLIEGHGTVLPAADVARAEAANHGLTVIAMVLGAIIGLISTFGVMDATARGQLLTMLLMPVPLMAALSFALVLGGHRTLSLVCLTAIVAAGTYGRRFGPRGFIGGILLFVGDLIGFFMHGAVKIDDLGWLAAETGVGLAVAIAVRFAFFYPHPARALKRTQRSFDARARKVAALALELFDDPDHRDRDVRRLQHQLVRLNEAALMIDAQLGDPASVAEGSSAELLHQRLFDVELALTNIARFAQAITRLDLPADQRVEARSALLALARRDTEEARSHASNLNRLLRDGGSLPPGEDSTRIVIAHRFAGSVTAFADAISEWLALGATADDDTNFQSSVTLFGGWLPGSAYVSAAASRERGSRWSNTARLAPYSRTAIQIGIAVGVSILLGELLSERRFYWAVIAAFITFMGAHNSGEQALKALQRVIGTVVGVVIGSLFAHAIGGDPYWSITLILISQFLGLYMLRVNYAFMAVAVTVAVSQLYVQLDEFSNSLLRLRLEETALGAAVAIAVSMLVLPLRSRHVVRIALRNYLQALGTLLDRATRDLVAETERGGESTLRSNGRSVDAAYQALLAAAQPVRRNLFGTVNEKISQVVRLTSASRHYSRNLVADAETHNPSDTETNRDIERAAAILHQSLTTITEALNGPRNGTYTRSAALFDRAERRLEQRPTHEERFAVRDLKLLDGTMAKLAELIGLRITDHDTVRLDR
jgi:uncharacterized membrane protein YccC